jgi:hypothetical protein
MDLILVYKLASHVLLLKKVLKCLLLVLMVPEEGQMRSTMKILMKKLRLLPLLRKQLLMQSINLALRNQRRREYHVREWLILIGESDQALLPLVVAVVVLEGKAKLLCLIEKNLLLVAVAVVVHTLHQLLPNVLGHYRPLDLEFWLQGDLKWIAAWTVLSDLLDAYEIFHRAVLYECCGYLIYVILDRL